MINIFDTIDVGIIDISGNLINSIGNNVTFDQRPYVNGSGVVLFGEFSVTGGSGAWSSSGANIYYNYGNVGLGTSNPQYTLDINGSGNFSSGVYISNKLQVSNNLTQNYSISAPTNVILTGGPQISNSNNNYTTCSSNSNEYQYRVYSYINTPSGIVYSSGVQTVSLIDCDNIQGASQYNNVFYSLNLSWNSVYQADGYKVYVLNDDWEGIYPGNNVSFLVPNTINNIYISDTGVYTSPSSSAFTLYGATNNTVTPTGISININKTGIFVLSGNVGINNIKPAYELDVSGTTNTSYLYVNQKLGINTKFPASELDVNGTTNTTKFTRGTGNNAIGINSSAEGYFTLASGNYSHTEGYLTSTAANIPGSYAHAEGYKTSAAGQYSHAEGGSTTTSATYSHAEGQLTSATAQASHAEGFSNITYGPYSHAEGTTTKAYTIASHSEGQATIASGNYSHAEGVSTLTKAIGSHAEGYVTVAAANYSHAEGYGAITSGLYSHAEGLYTIANGQNQLAIGQYNIPDATSLFIVGNGSSTSSRSNILAASTGGLNIFGSGNFTNGLYINGMPVSTGSSSSSVSSLNSLTGNISIVGVSGITISQSGSSNIVVSAESVESLLNSLSGYCNATFATIFNLNQTGNYLQQEINILSGNLNTFSGSLTSGYVTTGYINTLSGNLNVVNYVTGLTSGKDNFAVLFPSGSYSSPPKTVIVELDNEQSNYVYIYDVYNITNTGFYIKFSDLLDQTSNLMVMAKS